MIPKTLILFCVIFLPLRSTLGQDLIKSKGTAQMVLDDDISKEELKEELRMQAKLDAIERQFGSIIEQESRIEINEGGTTFDIVGDRYLKGEWLQTTKEKFTEEYKKVKTRGSKNKIEIWLKCDIEGVIREMAHPEIKFEFTTTNCPDKLCRTTDFIEGESMFLFFNSPVEGYLSVFTVEGEEAFRILPYQQMPVDFGQHIPIESDKEYMFFSADEKHDYFEEFSPDFADELIMTTEMENEFIYLYVIFSTNKFIKPTLNQSYSSEESDLIVPGSLRAEEFESWLAENRILNQDFYFKKLRLKISK